MRRAILATTAAAAAAALVLAGAMPAFAAGRSIPTVDAMYVLDCEVFDLVTGYSVNSSDAAAAPIGDGTTVFEHQCAYQAAYDVTTGLSYYVDNREDEFTYSALHQFDPATGESSDVDLFRLVGDGPDPIIFSIAIGTDGAAYAIDIDDNLYSLNLATAEVTFLTALADGQFQAFAVHPVTGEFYVAKNGDLFRIDVPSGALTPIHSMGFPDGQSIGSMQIDSAGVFWFLNGPMSEIDRTELWSATAVDGSEVLSGDLLDGDFFVESDSLLIIPGEALASTGGTVPVAPLYAGLGLLLLGGAVVLLRRRAA